MNAAVSIDELTFKMGQQTILNNISIHVPDNSIYGFIGHNGAGKTTTIKLILGLLQTSEGKINVFGNDISTERIEVLKNIGSLVEQPALYGNLTGYQNLKNRCILLGLNSQAIERVATLTQIEPYISKKAKNYSLGMKQRLGIALALLSDPKLLILDEPTNGLDPDGIREIRQLLQHLQAEEGKTIIISSHLLGEIEKMVTHIGVIKSGVMQFEGTLDQLPGNHKWLTIKCNDPTKAKEILSNNAFQDLAIENEILKMKFETEFQNARANKLLVEQGLDIYALETKHSSLEESYLQLQK